MNMGLRAYEKLIESGSCVDIMCRGCPFRKFNHQGESRFKCRDMRNDSTEEERRTVVNTFIAIQIIKELL